ncbi:hypothetical protein VTO42DRAFT_1938 [Malbranchea cinnamomea]
MTLRDDYEFVRVQDLRNGVAIVKFNRPQSGNAIHNRLLAETLSAFQQIDKRDDIKVVILTGEGRFFCTGKELADSEGPSLGPGSPFHQLNRHLILSDKVLVAAVNGPAVGYGVSSLALFDLVFSVPHAYFFTPFVKWGLVPEGASSVTFPRLMGHQRAAFLCLTGERITAQEAREAGLISKILPAEDAEDFLGQVVRYAATIAQQPPGALRAAKRLLKEPVQQQLLDANDRECRVMANERLPSGEPEAAKKQFAIEQELKRRRRTASGAKL